jgi:hypothetical protein
LLTDDETVAATLLGKTPNKQLEAMLAELGLTKQGTKEVMIKRIVTKGRIDVINSIERDRAK